MKQQSIWVSLVTLGRVGYLPASGTLATLVTIPSVIMLRYAQIPYMQEIMLLLLLTLAALFLINQAKPYFPYSHDPRPIVLDEVVGCLWAFCNVPLSTPVIIAGICIFRLLDIGKPWGIGLLERLPSPWGILLDDVAAGILTAVILHISLIYL